MSIPEVIPFEAVAANGQTRDCYWQKVRDGYPKKGEFYVSGALPMAYKARADLSTRYTIVKPTHFAERSTIWTRGSRVA